MKKRFIFFAFCVLGGFFTSGILFAQETTRLVPGVEGKLNSLLNKPALVKPAEAAPLGKNWFRLETDVHIITDQVSFKQVMAVLLDADNVNKIFDGKKSKMTGHIVSRNNDEIIMDLVSVSFGPLGLKVRTPYRASMKTIINTGTAFAMEVKQTNADNDTNKEMKNLYTTRYVEEIIVNGKTYTYIRTYGINDVNASILPNAKHTLEHSSGPAYEEALELIIHAAKSR